MVYNFPHCAWITAVKDFLNGSPLIEISNAQMFHDVLALLPQGKHQILLTTKDGQRLSDREVYVPSRKKC